MNILGLEVIVFLGNALLTILPHCISGPGASLNIIGIQLFKYSATGPVVLYFSWERPFFSKLKILYGYPP